MNQVTVGPDPAGAGDIVWLAVPAQTAYLSVLRTAAAGLAARLQFTLDEIEDLRIAVDEACVMLIRAAAPAAVLECQFHVNEGELDAAIRVPARARARVPSTSSFAWKMLASLTRTVRIVVGRDGIATISLAARRVAS